LQRVLRLILVVLLSTLTACRIEPTTTKLEGHYEGIKLDFFQDTGSSYPVTIDIEPTGTCLYSNPFWAKQPCHWERSADRITVRLTEGETLPFRWADGKLKYLKSDGAGGGVCIQLVKDRAVSDTWDDLCHRAMTGLPLPPK